MLRGGMSGTIIENPEMTEEDAFSKFMENAEIIGTRKGSFGYSIHCS